MGAQLIVTRALVPGDMPSAVCCHAYKSSNTSLTASTWTDITFEAEYFDTDSIHSTSSNTNRFIAPSTGKYRITFGICLSTGTGTTCQFAFCINGSKTYYSVAFLDSSGQFYGVTVTATLDLTANDYASLQMNPNLTSTVYSTATGAQYVSRAMFERIG